MPLLILVLLAAVAAAEQQPNEERHAAERIQQAQYCAAIERRAQHREIDRVQPVSHVERTVAATEHQAELDRLVTPEKLERK